MEACKTDFVARAVDTGQLYIIKLYLNHFACLDYEYRDEKDRFYIEHLPLAVWTLRNIYSVTDL